MLKLTVEQSAEIGDLWSANSSEEFDAVHALAEALGFETAREILARFTDPGDVESARRERLNF